jgi:glycosyltransferase involved in cell wall biosynthesis
MHIVKPLVALHRAKAIHADFMLERAVSTARVKRADVVVFCRNTEPANRWILDQALSSNKPVVYDLDDNFFHLSPETEAGRYHCRPDRMSQLEVYLKEASLVRVYSQELKEQVARLNHQVVRIAGPVDWELVPPWTAVRDAQPVRAVYATSRFHDDDLAGVFLGDLCQVLDRYPGRVEMVFWGYCPRDMRRHPAVRFRPPVLNYDRFFSAFARGGFEIGLAPLKDDAFHRSKSNVKFREYAACGIAGIYSNVRPYAESVESGVTGLLVPNQPGAWFEALSRLIEDSALRRAIRTQARTYSRGQYDLRLFQVQWLDQLQTVLAERPTTHPSFVGSRPLSRTNFCNSDHGVPASESVQRRQTWMGRWRRRAQKVIPSLRARGLFKTLHLVRTTVHDAAMLLRIRAQTRSASFR